MGWKYKDWYYIICQLVPRYWQCYTASTPTLSAAAREPLLAPLNWLESILQGPKAKKRAGIKQTIDSISPNIFKLALTDQVRSMFYWNQRELLSVVSHRCKEMAAWCWAVTTVKRWNEGSGSMAAWAFESGRKCTFFPSPLADERWAGAQHTGDGYRSSPYSTPHLQPVTLSGPWLSHPILQSPRGASWQLLHQAFLLSRVSNRCRGLFLWVWLLCITLRNFSLVCFFILWRNMIFFFLKGVGKRRHEMAADKKLCPWHGCVWILEMPQSTLTATQWPETINRCPHKDILP